MSLHSILFEKSNLASPFPIKTDMTVELGENDRGTTAKREIGATSEGHRSQ